MVSSLAAQATTTCAKVGTGHEQALLPSVLAEFEAACIHLVRESWGGKRLRF